MLWSNLNIIVWKHTLVLVEGQNAISHGSSIVSVGVGGLLRDRQDSHTTNTAWADNPAYVQTKKKINYKCVGPTNKWQN